MSTTVRMFTPSWLAGDRSCSTLEGGYVPDIARVVEVNDCEGELLRTEGDVPARYLWRAFEARMSEHTADTIEAAAVVAFGRRPGATHVVVSIGPGDRPTGPLRDALHAAGAMAVTIVGGTP